MQYSKQIQTGTKIKDKLDFFIEKSSEGFAVIELIFDANHNLIDYEICDLNDQFKSIIQEKDTAIHDNECSGINYSFNLNILKEISDALKSNHDTVLEYHQEELDKYYYLQAYSHNKKRITIISKDITEIKIAERKNIRLKNAMKALSILNNIIINENDSEKLLNRACEMIAELPDYSLAMITTLFKNTTTISNFYCSDKHVQKKYVEQAPFLPCISDFLEKQDSAVYYNPVMECEKCILGNKQNGNANMAVPMVFNNQIYGMLCVSLDTKLAFDQDESELLYTLASDLAFALFNIEARQDLEQARVKVRNYYQELDSQNKKLKILNAELEAKNNQLEQANQKANESEELKSHFLANISHEIRTPLNGILGFTQLIKQAKYMPEKMDEYFDIISFSGNQLMQTIDNILDISKLRTGQLEVKPEMCNIIELVEDVYVLNKTSDLNSKQLDFNTEIGVLSKGKFLYTDQSKLKQIINLLVQNAFKFTKKGSVTLGLRESGDQVLFYVQDTGIGISPEKYKIIFDSFRQADQKSTREFGGVGLGLSIAKGLVNILNGEIWLESELPDHKNAKNGGTTFYISIPYCTENNNEKQNKTMDLNKIETLDWSSKVILIVEDDTFSAEYLSEAISVTGAKLYHAQNGNDAILKAKEMPDLDLILMDIQLPGLSGDKATKAIREFNPEIPIIAQTAHAMINDRENYINAGCTDYISKPIAVNELFSILCKYL